MLQIYKRLTDHRNFVGEFVEGAQEQALEDAPPDPQEAHTALHNRTAFSKPQPFAALLLPIPWPSAYFPHLLQKLNRFLMFWSLFFGDLGTELESQLKETHLHLSWRSVDGWKKLLP